MTTDLLAWLTSRLEYFYELNMGSMGNFIVVQVLIFLKTNGTADDQTNVETKEKLERILDQHGQHMDKRTKLLLNYYKTK